MNQLDNGKRITLTSKPSNLLSNEKISLSASTPSISTTIDSSKLLISPTSLNSPPLVSSRSLPSSPLTHTPISSGVVPLSSTHINDKIVVSTSSESESNSVQSELVSEPTQAKTQIRRPLVSYEEEDSKGSSPEPQSVASNSVKEEVQEETLEEKVEEEATSLSEADCASSAAPLDAAVEDQKPSTSSASSADPSSAEQSQKPKNKRVRISLKLDQLSVLRLERLASENPKLLRKLGLKAYRINNFNGTSKRFQIIRVPTPVPRPSESSLNTSSQQLRGIRRPSRAPSTSSIGVVSFPPPSPTPRLFRAPYPHQRNISTFDYSKGNQPVTPAFPMDRTQQLQPQQFQYPAQYSSQQPQPQTPQYPSQQSPMQPQIRYQQPPQQQQMSQQPHQMMPVQQHPGYNPQQMHMMQQQQQYPPYSQQRMAGQGNMGPGAMQQMVQGGQPHMMPPQGIPAQQPMQPQQPVPQEAPKKRKRPSKKKKDDDQAKADAAAAAQAAQMEQRRLMQQQQQPPQQMQEYYMMGSRMPQIPGHMQHRMAQGYPYPGYPQGQASTSVMGQGYGYPQQQMWNPHEYQAQYPLQMMRPQGQQQNPGTPTSGYPPPHQSPGYLANANPAAVAAQQQQQKVKTPSYPQPSPQYAGGQTPQQAMNRQFMSPQNHPSPGFQQPPQQFGYPQPGQQPQQQQAGNRQGQSQQQASQQQNTSGGLEDYGNFHDYNGASLEDLAATFGDLGGEECDLDSITPMNTDPMLPQHQQQQQQQQQAHQQQMMQPNQQGIMHPQQQQMPPYDQQHQFVAPHMPPQHQQSPMGPPHGYYQQMPGHNQQDMQVHFQRPPSAGHQSHMMYIQQQQHHQQIQHQQQQQQQQQAQQQQQPQQQKQPPPPPPVNDKPPNGKNEDGFTTQFDADIKSPSKANMEVQRNIVKSIDFVINKIRTNENEYFDTITTQWSNNPNGEDPPPASATNKRKAKSTSSRPPSRQPKNSQPSSAAATPTSGLGPFFGGNSTGTEPSTPIKEESMDFKHERKNSTLSSLLSGSSTPTTIKCEENGHPENISASSIVKTESRDTETPQSVTSGITDPEHTVSSSISPTNNPPNIDAGVLKVEGNGNNNHGTQQQQLYNGIPTATTTTTAATTSPNNDSNTGIALKTKQETTTTTFSDTTNPTTADMPPPRKIRKTESSPNAVEDVSYYPGESDISTTATTS
uniref:Uncharacterized protein n=1 Tax=Panagrolaimus sp. PS1159 TaxID=55785 RepID=A0AC35FY09_9BILA